MLFFALLFVPLIAPLTSFVNSLNPNAYNKVVSKRAYDNQYSHVPSASYDHHPHYYKKESPAEISYGKTYQPYEAYGHKEDHNQEIEFETIDQCNTGSIHCCSTMQDSGNPGASNFLKQLGLLANVQGPFGVACSPITSLAQASQSCNAQPVCCTNTTFHGVVAFGCSPLNKIFSL